jgi:hypothetical protein
MNGPRRPYVEVVAFVSKLPVHQPEGLDDF